LTWLEDWWASAPQEERTWFERHLARTVPEYADWLEGGGRARGGSSKHLAGE